MKQGFVSRITDGLFRYQAWPTVCKDENGVLYVGCSGHRLGHLCPFGKNLMYVSRDEGETWSSPVIINDNALDDRDVGLTYLGEGKLLMTTFSHPKEFYFKDKMRDWLDKNTDSVTHDMAMGLLKGWETLPDKENGYGSFVKLSRDRGQTWDAPVKVPISSPHGPIRLSNGKLLFLGKEFHSGKYERGAIFAFESEDDGQTWKYLSRVDFPDGCTFAHIHEPFALELPNGRIIGMLRGDGDPIDYRFSSFICYSDDGGRSWTHPQPTGFCGSPPHLLLHSSGAIVLTYGRRAEPYGQRARISLDGGESFGEEIIISDFSTSADLGYPSTVELSDGSLLTVYYQKAAGDDYCSIMYTKWKIQN